MLLLELNFMQQLQANLLGFIKFASPQTAPQIFT